MAAADSSPMVAMDRFSKTFSMDSLAEAVAMNSFAIAPANDGAHEAVAPTRHRQYHVDRQNQAEPIAALALHCHNF